MNTNITKYQQKAWDYAQNLRDPRIIGLLIFLVIVLLIGWSGVKAIETNYGLQKQIAKLDQQNEIRRLTNENLKLQNDYYNTPQYLELSARKDFGLAAKGETVLIVPKTVALAHTIDLPQDKAAQEAEKQGKKPAYQRNFEAWMDFFMHRNTTAE
jgi:cell division protein FtsB